MADIHNTAKPITIGAPWLSSPSLKAIFDAFAKAECEVRVVGGAVRNALLNEPITDIDLATPALPDRVMEIGRAAGFGVYPTGLDHGTVTLVSSEQKFEITTLRRDVETDGRHAVVAFTTDWAEDAYRRDFTINAMSVDAHGNIFDYASGRDDIAARRVRFIGAAADRIREDYLRILRFFRFTAQISHSAPDNDGVSASIALKDGIASLSGERIGAEVMKFIVAPRAGEISVIMDVSGISQCIFGHATQPLNLIRMQAIEHALGEKPDAITRLAALTSQAPSHDVARRLRLSNAEASALATATAHQRTFNASTIEHTARTALYRLKAEAYRRAVRVSWANTDTPARDPHWTWLATLDQSWTPPHLPFSGADVLALGITPGPTVGQILKAFEQWWIEADFPSDANAQKERLTVLSKSTNFE